MRWGPVTCSTPFHVRAGIKVDFFVAGTDAFESERLQWRIAVAVNSAPARTLWIDTAAHTILRKLEWYCLGGRSAGRVARRTRTSPLEALRSATVHTLRSVTWSNIP